MKKTSLFYSLLFIASVIFLGSCGNKDDEAPQPSTPDECAQAEFPATTGTVTSTILNFSKTEGEFTVIDAGVNNTLAFAIELNKGDNRPQKLRVYQTDCANALGTIVTFPGKDTEDNGKRFDLRNVDSQIKNINYTVPSGMATIYLNFEIDESGNKYTYKRVKINVSGSGVIVSHENIKLGGDDNADDPSRLISTSGLGLDVCNAAGNVENIDITLIKEGTKLFLTSNPARSEIYGRSTDAPARCGDIDDNLSLVGGIKTLFTKTTLSFDNATNADLDAVVFGSAQNIEISKDDVIAFKTSNDKVGIIKVTNLVLAAPSSATISVKVQR
jgi:hypothetical protein